MTRFSLALLCALAMAALLPRASSAWATSGDDPLGRMRGRYGGLRAHVPPTARVGYVSRRSDAFVQTLADGVVATLTAGIARYVETGEVPEFVVDRGDEIRRLGDLYLAATQAGVRAGDGAVADRAEIEAALRAYFAPRQGTFNLIPARLACAPIDLRPLEGPAAEPDAEALEFVIGDFEPGASEEQAVAERFGLAVVARWPEGVVLFAREGD